MPTVLTIRNLMFMIHTRDHNPPHVTIYCGVPDDWQANARVNLENCQVMDSTGFKNKDIKIIEALCIVNRESFLEVWYETRS